jgi:hypothetical protein
MGVSATEEPTQVLAFLPTEQLPKFALAMKRSGEKDQQFQPCTTAAQSVRE